MIKSELKDAVQFIRENMPQFVADARNALSAHIQPRDETEQAIVNALGEISWDEAVEAIRKRRAGVQDSPKET